MKTSDMLKLIDYKITGGSSLFDNTIEDKILKKYHLQNETRCIEYSDDINDFSNRKYDGDITINGENVLRVTLKFPNSDGYFRWTDEKYEKFFKEIAKKYDYEDNCAFDNVNYTEIYLIEEMLEKIQNIITNGTCSYEVSYPLEIDQDFLKVAEVAAHKEGIEIEEWMKNVINENKLQFKRK